MTSSWHSRRTGEPDSTTRTRRPVGGVTASPPTPGRRASREISAAPSRRWGSGISRGHPPGCGRLRAASRPVSVCPSGRTLCNLLSTVRIILELSKGQVRSESVQQSILMLLRFFNGEVIILLFIYVVLNLFLLRVLRKSLILGRCG